MNTILRGVVGSTAYGLATPESDIDYMGVYMEPQEYFLGLRLVQERDLTVHKTGEEEDVTYHEVAKFCRLALKSNPSILEFLWLPEYDVVTPPGKWLIESRHWFASAKLVKAAYLGYAEQQFKLLQRRGDFGSDMKHRTEKHARHLYRLLIQGFGLYRTGELDVRLTQDEVFQVRGFGQAVGEGNLDLAAKVMAEYEELFNTRKPHVRHEPLTDAVDNMLCNMRKLKY
ncbi:nucleotidyltransferase [Streptomyces phage BRock]|uniref:Nucleotidyltransferase n=1 Tax=Streptomyces phage BRock TaxID=1913591 RepID=A0A1J0GW18_9CAUD|nr:nucleotidyltransferase [Streptomyces phage BRock]APC46372.1 nucleotidyltransferase [Streptomyces phage BRock]